MNDPDEQAPYLIEPENGVFKVVDGEGKIVISCADAANAEQYAVLLNQSYRRGFKAGVRKARTR